MKDNNLPGAPSRWDYNEEEARRGSPFLADVYHMRQLAIGFRLGLQNIAAVHDYFARSPILGSYLLVTGNEKLLKYISAFRFQDEDIAQVKKRFPDLVSAEFLSYLEDFRFRGDIWAVPEGQIVFGQNEPILKVVSNWLEGWFLETIIMSTMNSGLTYGTNATHFIHAAEDRAVIDFGLRRALGDGGRIQATRSVYAGGVAATSNIQAALNLGIPMSGTMSHEMIQALTIIYGSEKNAFKMYIREALKQDNALVLLVDTFEIERGAKNAIAALQEVSAELGKQLRADAFRIDSGDLYAEAVRIRALDPERKWFAGIFLTNDLGPEEIKAITEKDKFNRYITGFGAGTKLLNPPEVVGGVYKLSALKVNGAWTSTLKISASPEKSTLPGNKTLYREIDPDGNFVRDLICLADEPKPATACSELLEQVIVDGKIIIDPISLCDIQELGRYNLSRLPEKYRIYRKQETFPVEISPALEKLRCEVISDIRL